MKNKCIIMIGTSKETRGGISSVVKAYENEGLFDKYNIVYISTHIDGAFALKVKYAFKAFIDLFRIIYQKEVVLIHIHTASNYSFWRKSIFFFIGRAVSKKIIFHIHGGGFADFYTKSTNAFGRYLIRYILRNSCVVIVLSNKWMQLIGDIVHLRNLIALHNPIQDKKYFDIRNSPAENRVLFLGLIKEEKGIYDVLKAMSMLKEKYGIPIILDICGVGDVEKLNILIDQFSLSDQIIQHGWVSQVEIRRILPKAKIFLLPSYIEGLPMSILEAMAASVPVVASNVGGIPDLITDGCNGYLVQPGDVDSLSEKIKFLLENEQERKQIAQRGRSLVEENYNPEFIVEQLIGIYRQVLGEDVDDLLKR